MRTRNWMIALWWQACLWQAIGCLHRDDKHDDDKQRDDYMMMASILMTGLLMTSRSIQCEQENNIVEQFFLIESFCPNWPITMMHAFWINIATSSHLITWWSPSDFMIYIVTCEGQFCHSIWLSRRYIDFFPIPITFIIDLRYNLWSGGGLEDYGKLPVQESQVSLVFLSHLSPPGALFFFLSLTQGFAPWLMRGMTTSTWWAAITTSTRRTSTK